MWSESNLCCSKIVKLSWCYKVKSIKMCVKNLECGIYTVIYRLQISMVTDGGGCLYLKGRSF